jgi:hypothetical protein
MLSQRCVAEIDLRSLSSPIGLFLDGGDHAVCVPGECQRSSRSLSACPCIQAAAELYAAWDQAPRSRDANRVTRHRQPTTSRGRRSNAPGWVTKSEDRAGAPPSGARHTSLLPCHSRRPSAYAGRRQPPAPYVTRAEITAARAWRHHWGDAGWLHRAPAMKGLCWWALAWKALDPLLETRLILHAQTRSGIMFRELTPSANVDRETIRNSDLVPGHRNLAVMDLPCRRGRFDIGCSFTTSCDS